MEDILRHMATCCSSRGPADTDSDLPLDDLACCMEQLRVVGSPTRDSSCNSRSTSAIKSPRPRTSKACAASTASAAAASTGLPQYRIFTFDIETTGFSTTKDAIIEMAVVDVASGDCWSSLVKPEPYRKSSRDAYKAHGISHYDLINADVPTSAAALQILQGFITKHTAQQRDAVPLLVAHNGFNFDFKALAVAVYRQQQEQQQQQQQDRVASGFYFGSTSSSRSVQMPQHLMVMDSLVLARRLRLHKQLGLSNLQQATIREHILGSPPTLVHRALADSQELAALLPHLLHWAAAHASEGLDEKLLPRSFASFMAAAAAATATAAAAAADVVGDDSGNVKASSSSSNNCISGWDENGPAAAHGDSALAAAASCNRGGRKASSSSNRGRKKTVLAAATVQRQQASSDGWVGVMSLSAAVAAAASTALEVSSDGDDDDDESSQAAEATQAATGEASTGASAVAKAPAETAGRVQTSEDCSQQPVTTSSSSNSGSSGTSALESQDRQSSSKASNLQTQSVRRPATAASGSAVVGATAAGVEVSSAAVAAAPSYTNIRGVPVPIMPSSGFLQIAQSSLSNASSSSGDDDTPGRLLQLGRFTPGRLDPSSGFSEVLLRPGATPIVFCLEGLVISKLQLKFNNTDGRMQAVSLFVKAASRKRALQQHIKQVGAAVDNITQLLPGQQQQQQQDVFSCMSGTSLQVRLPVKPGAPYLDATVRQLCCELSSGWRNSDSFSSSSSGSRRLLPVATPNLAAGDAAERLQQLLPVGRAVNVVLCPSSVWSNSRFRGVTLNCVEVWLI